MSTNNREFDFFALMASLEAHMLKDPNVRDASPSEALENYFSRKGKRSQRRKNAFRAQRHRRDVMAEKFDTTSKNDGILRKTYKDGYAKFESSHGRVKKEDKFRVTADKSSLDKSDKTWSLIISDIKANSILPACKTDAGTLRDMYAMYAKRCSSCGLRFVRNYSVGSSTGTKAPAIIEVVLPDNSIGYYLLMCKANETKSGPSLRDAMPLISSMLMMESNGKRVLGAYFVADRFSNGFVQDVSRLVEPINRNRTDRFEIRVCDTNTPLVLAVPAVSAQAAPVNINVGITIKKTR